jgi:hypothetical protein
LAVGLLLPKPSAAQLASSSYWVSTSSFGSSPPVSSGSGGNLFSGGISPDQILYYARTDAVMTASSNLAHLNEPPYVVRNQISLVGPPESTGGSSGAPNSGAAGVVNARVQAPTSAEALALNTAFDEALNRELNSVAQASLTGAEQQTESTLLSVENDIATNHFAPGLTAQALQVEVGALQEHLASLIVQQPDTGFQVLQQPSAALVSEVTPNTTTSRGPLRAGAGLGIGLLVGALAALALWLLDKRLQTVKRAQAAFGYPVVAEIPLLSSDSVEPYRMLWLSVFREPLPRPPSEQNERWYDGEDPVLDQGVGLRSGPQGGP